MPAAASAWKPLTLEPSDPAVPDRAQASVELPAGGWYRLEVRLHTAVSALPTTAAVEPFGVGEVFVVAGQSYATNTNDPQPAPDRSDGGSIWPAVGDRPAAALDVPIGFVNVAFGGTSTRQWEPDGPLSARLQAIRAAAVASWNCEPVWLCAFSTHHPPVYRNPEGEDRIRAAISRLGQLPGFRLGGDLAVHVGEAEVADLEAVGELRVFEAEHERA